MPRCRPTPNLGRESPRAAAWTVRRVRAENDNPRLLVILVRVLDLPQNAAVRAAQASLVATDVNAVLVSSDGPGFEDGTSDHLTDAAYQAVALRILAALR